ncbi:MAG: PAS domain S-box protein [Pseudomonadota bacterium]
MLDSQVHLVLAAAPDATLVVNGPGRIVFASDRVEALIGRAPKDLIGQPLEGLVPERLRGLLGRFRQELFASPGARLVGFQQPLHALHADGREIPIELVVNEVDLDGAPHLVMAVRDIAERVSPDASWPLAVRRLQERLADVFTQFRQFVEHVPAPVAM